MARKARASKRLTRGKGEGGQSIADMVGAKVVLPAGTKRKSRTPARKAAPKKATGKRKRAQKAKEEPKGGESSDEEMQEASSDEEEELESSGDEEPARKRQRGARRQPARLQKTLAEGVGVDKDLMAELGLSSDSDDAELEEILSLSQPKRKKKLAHDLSDLLKVRAERLDVAEVEQLEKELETSDEDDKISLEANVSSKDAMEILGGKSAGIEAERLYEVLANSSGDVREQTRYNFLRWADREGKTMGQTLPIVPQLYDMLAGSPLAGQLEHLSKKERKQQGRVEIPGVSEDCAFLACSGWLQVYVQSLRADVDEDLCMWLFHIVAFCSDDHLRASAFHQLDAIVRHEPVALSSVVEYAPNICLQTSGWALPFPLFMRTVAKYGMSTDSFIPTPPDESPMIEMGSEFSDKEPKGGETFPSTNVLLVVRTLEGSVTANPDAYSQDELLNMALMVFCFILDPWLNKELLVLESFITSVLNAFSHRAWKSGRVIQQLCERLCDRSIIADETQLVGSLKHISISRPAQKDLVDRGRLVKSHCAVHALCLALGMEVPEEWDYARFPPMPFVTRIAESLVEEAMKYTDGAETAEKKARDYSQLFAHLCLLELCINKSLYEAAQKARRQQLKNLVTVIRNLDMKIKDRGGTLHLARKRVKGKLLQMECTIDMLLL